MVGGEQLAGKKKAHSFSFSRISRQKLSQVGEGMPRGGR